ncbi:MAG TPA: acyl-CoA dehydrogenase family protein [Acidimicrobiales bacterium]|jgi:alkylation response protein AidB-like acyl-CoA dehydrogenase|nr:acyl-CoA dehydrogenase family protein [Acidimicrobiales bacterium]
MSIADDVRAWLEEHVTDEMTLREYWAALAEAGWAFPTWPTGYGGRDMAPGDARQVAEALQAAGAVAPPAGLGQMMGAPIVLEHGTEEQRDRWVRDLAAGRESWCQLFSEPGAGSDLASLQTKAVRDGDVWIVNGQKVWTSGARTADRAMLVARTDPDAPKHKGITYFIIDMDQPGIEVRPLKQMDGGASFNEVFLTDATVPHDNLIGAPNVGWMVAVSTLAYERQGIGGRGGGGIAAGAPGEKSGLLDVPIGELKERARQARGEQAAMAAATGSSAIFELAREFDANTDPVQRDRIMRYFTLTETHRLNLQRARAATAAGKRPGPEVSTAKLTTSKIAHTTRDVTLGIEGAHGMLYGDDAPHGGRYQQIGLRAHASSIAGGSDEIQRNIIGERVLGLPKEPQVDRDQPFKELKVGTQR